MPRHHNEHPFSLRAHLIERGYNGATLTSMLGVAHDVVSNIPGVSIRTFNPRRPMEGVNSG